MHSGKSAGGGAQMPPPPPPPPSAAAAAAAAAMMGAPVVGTQPGPQGAGMLPPAYPSMPVEPPPPYSPYAATPSYNPQFVQPPPPPPAGPAPTLGHSTQSQQQFVTSGTAYPQATINVHVIHSRMGPFPQQVTCGKCGAHVMTATSARPGLLAWLLACSLIGLGCVWGCCLIPCCVPECQDIEHHCPSCQAHLGTFKRF